MLVIEPAHVKAINVRREGTAVRLCDAIYGMIWRYEGETVHLAGVQNFPDAELEQVRGRFPRADGGMFGELNEKQDEYVKDISASGTHLLSLINDILDLSKIEAGRMKLEVTEFDLPSAVENALILVRERASRRGIMLGQTIDPRAG
jgi:signal transduction histidine kinase